MNDDDDDDDDVDDPPPAALLIPFFEQDVKQDTLNTDLEFSNNPFLAIEKASQLLLSFLAANTPWKITAAFLFNICHILEDTLALFGISASTPSSIMLIPVLRTMRIWRVSAHNGRNLGSLASDLAALINVELSTRKPMHATILKCNSLSELQQMSLGKAHEDKENVLSTRLPQYRRHRTQQTTKRKARNPYLKYLPDKEFSSPFPYGSCAVSTSGSHSDFARPLCGTQSYAEPLQSLILSSQFVHESGGECIYDSTDSKKNNQEATPNGRSCHAIIAMEDGDSGL